MKTYFEPVISNFGFDNSVNPDWFLVLLNDRKPLRLINGEGMTVISLSPSIATVAVLEGNKALPVDVRAYKNSVRIPDSSQRQIIVVKGNSFGRTVFEVRKNNELVTRLEVSVRPKVTLRLSFNLVADRSKQTVRTKAEVEDILKLLNSTYLEQTGIEFTANQISQLRFDKQFGSAVNYKTDAYGKTLPGHDWDLITSKRDKSAHINIYFVWDLEVSDKNTSVWGLTSNRDCFISDQRVSILESTQTVGHEIGHVLGIDDLTKTKRQRNPVTNRMERVLVNADNYTLGYGDFIPRHQANIMWEIARQIAGKTK